MTGILDFDYQGQTQFWHLQTVLCRLADQRVSRQFTVEIEPPLTSKMK
jgi:hypothetical protein